MTFLPPLTLWVRVERPDRERPFRLWLPLFLLWLVLLPLVVLVLAFTLVADAVLLLTGDRYHHYTLLLLGCFQTLAASRGTVVRVNGEHTIVRMTLA